MDISLRMDPVFNIGWYPEYEDEEYEFEEDSYIIRKAALKSITYNPGGRNANPRSSK